MNPQVPLCQCVIQLFQHRPGRICSLKGNPQVQRCAATVTRDPVYLFYLFHPKTRPYSESYPFPLRGSFWCAATGQVRDGCVKLSEVAVLSCLCQWKVSSMSSCEQSINSVPRYLSQEGWTTLSMLLN